MEVASTSDIMPITHPRQHNPQHRSKSLRRVLDEIAIRVGRADGQGTPVLWRLKPEFLEPRYAGPQSQRDRTGWHDGAPMRAF